MQVNVADSILRNCCIYFQHLVSTKDKFHTYFKLKQCSSAWQYYCSTCRV